MIVQKRKNENKGKKRKGSSSSRFLSFVAYEIATFFIPKRYVSIHSVRFVHPHAIHDFSYSNLSIKIETLKFLKIDLKVRL